MLTEMRPEIVLAAATIFSALLIAVANARNTRKAHEEKKKQAKREKLEQLMRATHALEKWAINCEVKFSTIESGKEYKEEFEKITRSPMAKIETLATLYFNDELKDSMNALSLYCENFTNKIVDTAVSRLSDLKSSKDQQGESIMEYHDELIRLIIVVQNDCKTVMIKLNKW